MTDQLYNCIFSCCKKSLQPVDSFCIEGCRSCMRHPSGCNKPCPLPRCLEKRLVAFDDGVKMKLQFSIPYYIIITDLIISCKDSSTCAQSNIVSTSASGEAVPGFRFSTLQMKYQAYTITIIICPVRAV